MHYHWGIIPRMPDETKKNSYREVFATIRKITFMNHVDQSQLRFLRIPPPPPPEFCLAESMDKPRPSPPHVQILGQRQHILQGQDFLHYFLFYFKASYQ